MHPYFVQNSFSSRPWILQEAPDREVLGLAQRLGESDVIARLLVARGISQDEAPHFLAPTLKHFMGDPSRLKDMDRAVERLTRAIVEKESIAIWGDYDVDGATSTALLCRFLKDVGAKVQFYIPDRLKEGYGPNAPGLLKLKSQEVSVIVTVDCGTNAFDALETAHQAGLDVIVLDHHAAEPQLPIAYALVNPNQLQESPENQRDFGSLAAVGLSFLLVVALGRALKAHNYPHVDLFSFLDLVALGTVCDVVPLKGLNRAFVTQGLKILAQRQNYGLKTLGDLAGLEGPPTVYHLGFVLGPRINAGGRIGQADLGTRLLLTDDSIEATRLSQTLHGLNQERKDMEEMVYLEALSQVQDSSAPLILVGGDGWHPGVIGIVAGRLKERFQRPTCVVAFEEDGDFLLGKASGRSVTGFDLGNHVHGAKQAGLLRAGGGHAMAAGFTVEKAQFEALKEYLTHQALKVFSHIQNAAAIKLDGIVPLRSLTLDLLKKVEKVGPFGSGNPTPRFALPEVEVAHVKVLGEKHLKLVLRQMDGTSMDAMMFRASCSVLGETLLRSQGRRIHVVGTAQINRWQGRERVQLFIDDAADA